MVQLKVVPLHLGQHIVKFQYLMVQLKVYWLEKGHGEDEEISIPHGTIKR